MDWIIQNWYVVWGLLCFVAVVACWLHFRRNPEAPGARAFFWLFPGSDPTGQTPTGLTPRAIVLWVVGILIVLAANLFVPGFS